MENTISEMRKDLVQRIKDGIEARRKKAQQLREQGCTNAAIAKKLGVSEGTLLNWFHKE